MLRLVSNRMHDIIETAEIEYISLGNEYYRETTRSPRTSTPEYPGLGNPYRVSPSIQNARKNEYQVFLGLHKNSPSRVLEPSIVLEGPTSGVFSADWNGIDTLCNCNDFRFFSDPSLGSVTESPVLHSLPPPDPDVQSFFYMKRVRWH